MGNDSSRDTSPVVAVVLLVAVAVLVLGGLYSLTALDFGPAGDGSAPSVSESDGRLWLAGDGSYSTVELTHEAGDTLNVSELELVVSAQSACGKSGRLFDLPAPDGDLTPASAYVRGDDIFDTSDDAVTGPIGEDNVTVDGTWSAGETATFRIDSGACSLSPGNEILVRISHAPTGAVLTQQRLTAESA
ncbi:type IV pilin [Haloarcula sediminis]|uniref:type IV pilin n=1 Tax=Haloarcula sediminis TaxID=3111777 RepID=UPI002D76505D|nr:type IV pilin [Haloarcula sp. CK38]